ncbi:hypothetical protein PENDEC_c007G06291 [Penicillium decumbens]|uniref:IQ calmodulin-binding motif protein n=1 Tax=Penicillium decumbens TaxID=69771 RepID=A0A1V6PEI3_PENDC|nr:hypothetical protein PENDEC_c007G06291 [Penicillium decumbens]
MNWTVPTCDRDPPTDTGDMAVPHDPDDVTFGSDPERAARTIQRYYRGYRTRRELRGLGLRRLEPTPPPREYQQDASKGYISHSVDTSFSPARQNWHRAVNVAMQASVDDDRTADTNHADQKKAGSHSEILHETAPKMMDLEYFLEMVDAKHRHGSNLRAYHTLWKNSPTSQNFFYWLDQGEGKDVDLPQRPRERLEKEQVRYLSPEERYNYLVKIDSTGRFRWANNDELVDTDDNRYRDSLHGVVPVEDDTPGFKGNSILESTPSEPESTSSPSSPSPGHTEHTVEENHEKQIHSTQGDHELRESVKEPARAKPAAIYDRFARSLSFEKGMWIFVADASFRIYVGIKEPGTFQHSSFLRGGRISAAGMLKIRNGQLRSLAPLSGHYRPHVANFRAFHHHLRQRGVDLSRVSISKSYAVLAGIEGYALTKRKMHAMHDKLDATKEKIHMRHPHAADA